MNEDSTETVDVGQLDESTETPAGTEGTGQADESDTPARRYGRAPMSDLERQKRLNFRACTKAADLLIDHGFTVTAPEGWEDPEVERKRANAKRALEELRAAGVDVSSLLDS